MGIPPDSIRSDFALVTYQRITLQNQVRWRAERIREDSVGYDGIQHRQTPIYPFTDAQLREQAEACFQMREEMKADAPLAVRE